MCFQALRRSSTCFLLSLSANHDRIHFGQGRSLQANTNRKTSNCGSEKFKNTSQKFFVYERKNFPSGSRKNFFSGHVFRSHTRAFFRTRSAEIVKDDRPLGFSISKRTNRSPGEHLPHSTEGLSGRDDCAPYHIKSFTATGKQTKR